MDFLFIKLTVKIQFMDASANKLAIENNQAEHISVGTLVPEIGAKAKQRIKRSYRQIKMEQVFKRMCFT